MGILYPGIAVMLVAGTDLYAHKPVVDLNQPFLRPEV